MDVCITPTPEALFATMCIDTLSHFTQVVTEGVRCPGHASHEFHLRGKSMSPENLFVFLFVG